VQQVLFYPVTDANFDTESYHQYAEGYFLRRDAMQWFWDQYTTDPAQRAEITASPLRASLNELAGLPPALVITGEADVLRDEGEAYAARLRAAGVSVIAARYQGIIHDFVMLNALRGTHAATAAIAQAITTLAGALHPTDAPVSSETLYIKGLRLDRARRDLLDPRLAGHPVSAIAYACGFGDLSGFNRAFKQAYAVSPRQLRNSSASPAGPRRRIKAAGRESGNPFYHPAD
jgi:AraC-like DNA-binding protein